MKKLIVSLSLVAFLMMSAWMSISSEMKVNCKRWLGLPGSKKTNTSYTNEDEKNKASGSTFLPFNSWDAKMMIW